MSRSFVRAWATVATIIAMVCFAFVQPMPDHLSSGSSDNGAQVSFETSSHEHLDTTAPFVDSVVTGKTFTPYMTIGGLPVFHNGGADSAVQTLRLEHLSPPALEPPIRPG